jgi:hypothetical protein
MKTCSFKYAANISEYSKSIWGRVIEYYYDHVHFEIRGITFNSWLAKEYKARIEGDNLIFEDEKYYNWFMLRFQ